MRRALAALSVAALLLAGCASTEGKADEDPPSGTNADTEAAEPADTETSEAADPGQLSFGQAYTYEDGLTVKVSEPRPFEPGESAAAKPGPAVVFTVVVVNKTGKPFDATLFYITLQSGNEEAPEIFDSEKGIEGSPSTKVLDGREAKWKIAYNVKDPADLVLEVQPDAGVEYASVIYVS